MKKVYQKPALYIEEFTVDKSFAMSCGAEPGTSEFGSPDYCSYANIFLVSKDFCEIKIPEDFPTQQGCYNLLTSYSPFAS